MTALALVSSLVALRLASAYPVTIESNRLQTHGGALRMWLYAGYIVLIVFGTYLGLLGLLILTRGHFKLTSGKRCEGTMGRILGGLYLLTAILAFGSLVLYENSMGAGMFHASDAEISPERRIEIATNEILIGFAVLFTLSALTTWIALMTSKAIPENVYPTLPEF
jgi:hypothetical protein